MRSALFTEFTKKFHTTVYHPISNGIIKRFHRQLKSSIKAHESNRWTETLPIVLGIRTAVKADIQASCSELIFGTTFRLPCDIVDESFVQSGDQIFALPREVLSSPIPDFMFIHFSTVDLVQRPQCQPYSGPHKVLSRTEKTLTIDFNESRSTVSIV